MNVFVLSVGCSGSEVFANACGHITNYTVGFETRNERSGEGPYSRLHYPNRHIEIDDRLAGLLGPLDKAFGNDAFYVHLLRDRDRVADALLQSWFSPRSNPAAAFACGTLGYSRGEVDRLPADARLEIARRCYDVTNANITAFLKDKTQKATVRLLELQDDFRSFWEGIRAEGDLDAAMSEWSTRLRRDRRAIAAAETAHGKRSPEPCRPAERAREGLERAILDAQMVDVSWVSQAAAPRSWAVDGQSLQLAAALVRRLSPRHVIQFGTGLATQVLVRECGDLPLPSRVTAIDHDPDYLRITRFTLKAQRIPTSSLHLLHCPLVARNMEGNPVPAFMLRANEFASQEPADLVLMQAPPAVLGGREGILYQALDFARPGTVMLLENTDRPGEEDIVHRWMVNLGSAIELHPLPDIGPGMAAVIVREPVRSTELKQHQMKLLSEEINNFVPRSETIIVVDNQRWGEHDTMAGRPSLPFTEEAGHYNGPPRDDQTGVRELERLRKRGAGFIVFAWPAFDWLDHYPGLHRHLRRAYSCVHESGRVVAFDLRRESKLSLN